MRRPPRSTLFPYTPLSRSRVRERGIARREVGHERALAAPPQLGEDRREPRPRSEEHTSELQSLAYLVCRLLLEKKKKYITLRDRQNEQLNTSATPSATLVS